MAAPHISGLVGLMRSTNPLLTRAQVKADLADAAGGTRINNSLGYGLPNASTAVFKALPVNRLTPLFAFANTEADDFVYTVFPQMGAALNNGTVPPFAGTSASTSPYYSYPWIGTSVAQYPSTFPGVTIMVKFPLVTAANYLPRARLRVFTTPKTASGVSLWPICRFSYVVSATTVRHIVDTAPSCAQSLLPSIAILDGQEGYVFPPNQPQPSGTVPVIRMDRNPGGGAPLVWIFTAQTDAAYYTGLGFANPTVLGYAYLN
jgi:serine protease